MKKIARLVLVAVIGVATVGCTSRVERYEVTVTDYHPQPSKFPTLVDDKLADKITTFDPESVHSEPMDGWLVNLSDAVTKLDVPIINPDAESHLLKLHPSYKAAIDKNRSSHSGTILTSVNMVDGKAKQFDDGLYAALDQAYYEGLEGAFTSHVDLVKRVLDKVGPSSVAAPFLAAGLELSGCSVEVDDAQSKAAWLVKFHAEDLLSKPIGFYTWNESLGQCFQFSRFFQQPFDQTKLDVPLAIAKALSTDDSLLNAYKKANAFYARLTNPLKYLTVADLVGVDQPNEVILSALQMEREADAPLVAFLPDSSSREDRLFTRLFADGVLPASTNLMQEFVRRIRSGELDLTPQPNSGWYDYQVFALETMLLPENGEESSKLLLTRTYKKRMLEAFKALVTKRRETHVRQQSNSSVGAAAPPTLQNVQPRLRIEPCPSYQLRTARSYSFLLDLLVTTIGEEGLKNIHGLRRGGPQEDHLLAELTSMRDLFYGLYLISVEDIGLRPTFLEDEIVDQDHCYQLAIEWLARVAEDPDLAADTRVAVSILHDALRNKTRLWVNVGVRLTKLEASFARPPSIKPAEVEGEWQTVESWKLRETNYLIPVDEFVEVEVHGNVALTRDELRELCDGKTKEGIVAALSEYQ